MSRVLSSEGLENKENVRNNMELETQCNLSRSYEIKSEVVEAVTFNLEDFHHSIDNKDESECESMEQTSSRFQNKIVETAKDEYEVFRNKNINERKSYLALSDDGDSETDEFKRSLQELQDHKNKLQSSRPQREKRKRGNGDHTFKFTGFIPKERRRSHRIAKLPPIHTSDVLDDENLKSSYNSNSVDDLERIAFRPKKIQRVLPQNQTVIFLPVDEVTNEMIAKIAKSSTKKKYSVEGTSCHQCRQKTTDTKTVCRSGRCVGLNGQMCGPCLKNRYGEDVAAALMNPNWECPFCRKMCNCSICRTRQGKRPTGILAPMALQQGFESVKHFLENLNNPK